MLQNAYIKQTLYNFNIALLEHDATLKDGIPRGHRLKPSMYLVTKIPRGVDSSYFEKVDAVKRTSDGAIFLGRIICDRIDAITGEKSYSVKLRSSIPIILHHDYSL